MNQLANPCRLCPRQCGVDRVAGQTGYCGAGAATEIFSYGPHHGEEPPLIGSKGSGTVFFGRCTLSCIYCQNYPWSQEEAGKKYSHTKLVEIFKELSASGCHNLNLVSPTPWLAQIVRALSAIKHDGVDIPVVYNTSGFERVETVNALRDMMDIWLVDLRYSKPETARIGSDAASYVQVARAAVRQMWEQTGPIEFDDNGIVRKGVICRILVLPDHAEEATENVNWLAREVSTDIGVSVMAQYTPAHWAVGKEGWGRRITAPEYRGVCDAFEEAGFVTGWVQECRGESPSDLVGYNMKQKDEG